MLRSRAQKAAEDEVTELESAAPDKAQQPWDDNELKGISALHSGTKVWGTRLVSIIPGGFSRTPLPASWDDNRPIHPRARAMFYVFLAVLMHMEMRLGLKKKAYSPWTWPWPLHDSQLASNGVRGYCVAPRKQLNQDGLKSFIVSTLDLMIWGVGSCEQAFHIVSWATLAALLIAACTSWRPERFGAATRRLPAVAVAFGVWLLNGSYQATRDTNHRWQLPMVCTALLVLDDPLRPSVTAREMCIGAAGCILGNAGLSKLTASTGWPSLEWMKGDTLRWHLSKGNRPLLPLPALLLQHRPLLVITASGTVLLELLGWLVATMSRKGRAPLVVLVCFGWSMMHCCIVMCMTQIQYVTYTATYMTLLFPWAARVGCPLSGGLSAAWLRSPPLSLLSWHRIVATSSSGDMVRVVVRCVITLSFLVTLVLHAEAWPASCVPMFSHLRNESWADECLTQAQARQLATERFTLTGEGDWSRATLIVAGSRSRIATRTGTTRLFRSDATDAMDPDILMRPDPSYYTNASELRTTSSYQSYVSQAFRQSLRVHYNVSGEGATPPQMHPALGFMNLALGLTAARQDISVLEQHGSMQTNSWLMASGSRLLGMELTWQECGKGTVLGIAARIDGKPLYCPNVDTLKQVPEEELAPAVAAYYGMLLHKDNRDALPICDALAQENACSTSIHFMLWQCPVACSHQGIAPEAADALRAQTMLDHWCTSIQYQVSRPKPPEVETCVASDVYTVVRVTALETHCEAYCMAAHSQECIGACRAPSVGCLCDSQMWQGACRMRLPKGENRGTICVCSDAK